MPQVEEFINKYFPYAVFRGGEYHCKCPAHDDNRESLHIKQGDVPDGEGGTKIVMNCKAGCSNEEILKELGASWDEINGRSRTEEVRKKLQRYFQLGDVTEIYDYRDQEEKYLYSKVRFLASDGSKEIRFTRINYRLGTFDSGRGGLDPTLYQLPELLRSIRSGYPVYIVEGEKDVHTLRDRLHWRATTAGAAGDWKDEYARYFKGARVVILPDNDDPGREAAERIRRGLKGIAYQLKVVKVSDLSHGDVTDYLTKESGSPEALKQMIEKQPWEPAEWLTIDKKGKHTINADLLARTIEQHEDYLFIRMPEEDKDAYYVYQSGVYRRCNVNDFIALVIRPYIPVGYGTPYTLDSVRKLLQTSGSHCRGFDELDNIDPYINLGNGLLNRNTWELEPHRPDVLSTIQLTFDYDPYNNKRPSFDKYMKDLIRAPDNSLNQDLSDVIQEFFGMTLSNVPMYKLKKALFLVSFIGNTGKSSLLRLIDSMLGGDHTAAIDLRELDPSKGGGNRFTLGKMRGRRLIECGDQSSAVISDSSLFKELTGGDKVKIEEKGKQGDYFRFAGGIVIASNQIPVFNDDHGDHLMDRIQIIPLQHTIRKKDTELEEKMIQEKSAIFNWFMEGLKRVTENNYELSECKTADNFIKEYREEADSLYRFLVERYDITFSRKDLVRKTDFDQQYHIWCAEINASPSVNERVSEVRGRAIKYRMMSYGIHVKKTSVNGHTGRICYMGIKEKKEENEN